jgi:hypothetical protein
MAVALVGKHEIPRPDRIVAWLIGLDQEIAVLRPGTLEVERVGASGALGFELSCGFWFDNQAV